MSNPTLTSALIEQIVKRNILKFEKLEVEIQHLIRNINHETDIADDLRSDSMVKLMYKMQELPTPLDLKFSDLLPSDEVKLSDLGPGGGSSTADGLYVLAKGLRTRVRPVTPRVIRRYSDDVVTVLEIPSDNMDGSPKICDFAITSDFLHPFTFNRLQTPQCEWLKGVLHEKGEFIVPMDSTGLELSSDLEDIIQGLSVDNPASNIHPSTYIYTNSSKIFSEISNNFIVEVADIVARVPQFTDRVAVLNPFHNLIEESKVRYSLSPSIRAFNACMEAAKKFFSSDA
jgi:hypothetical protein